MNINGTEIIDHGKWNTYKYEFSTISVSKESDNISYPEYLHLIFFFTHKNDQGKGHFKENLKNILTHAKGQEYKGIYARDWSKVLSKKGREIMEIGVKNGWIKKDNNTNPPIYKIENIN